MRTLGNIVWHVPFLGFISALATFLTGGLLIVTVIGAPIGLGLIQLSRFLLMPFSSAMIDSKDIRNKQNKAWQAFGIVARIIYFPLGLVLAVLTALQVAGLFVSIVGIPVALVLAKSLGTFFNPVNKVCVHRSVAAEVTGRKAKEKVDRAFNA